MKAIWKDKVIAESDQTIVIEGNHYFPPESINKEYLATSDTHTVCPWKGQASYHNIEVEGALNKDAAWYYPETTEAAKGFRNYIAFWRGVEVVE